MPPDQFIVNLLVREGSPVCVEALLFAQLARLY